MSTQDKILAWHFLSADKRLRYDDGRLVVAGETLSVPDPTRPLKLSAYGMHASERAIDAFRLAPGFIACRVEVWGEVQRGEDKIVGRHRRCVWMVDSEKAIQRWAVWCARQALRHAGDRRGEIAAHLAVAERYFAGKASRADLSAARDALWRIRAADAAAAAYDAADAASADVAAYAYADVAAYAAAYAAARAKAIARFNKKLTQMLIEAHKKEGK